MLGIVLLLALFRPQASPPSGPAEWFHGGEQALARGDLDQAEQAFRRVLAADPRSAAAHGNLGVVYMRRRDWPRALAELKAAERLAPDQPGIGLNIGLVHYRRGDYQAAIPAFESVVRKQPEWGQPRELLGLSYFFEERYEEARQTLEPLWPAESGKLTYLYVLAIAAGKSGQPQLEERSARRMVEVGQDSAELHLYIGKAYYARGDDDHAIEELSKAAARDAKLPFVHYQLGLAYRRRQDVEKARAEFLEDARIEPEVPYNYAQLGDLSFQRDEIAGAEGYYRRAVALEPRIAGAQFGLAKIYREQGRLKEALAAADAARRLDPESASVRYVRAQVLRALGRKQEAEAEFAESTRLRQAVRDRLERQVSGRAAEPQLGRE